MKERWWEQIEGYRVQEGQMASNPGDPYGAFQIPIYAMEPVWAEKARTIRLEPILGNGVIQIVVSDGLGWDHVSACIIRWGRGTHRSPTWREMCWLKEVFFNKEECAIQYHPPEAEYIWTHPHALHLWRPQEQEIPMPPSIMVGVGNQNNQESDQDGDAGADRTG